jgi:O-antigen ligase
MSTLAMRMEPRAVGVALLAVAVALGAGILAARAPLHLPFLLVAGAGVSALAFLRTELAIHLLILSMLLSPEFALGGSVGSGAGLEGSRAAVIRLEDLLLVIIGAAWLGRMAVHKQLGLILRNPLNGPILLYSGVALMSTLFGIMGGRVEPLMGFLFLGKYIEYFVVFVVAVNHIRDWMAARRVLITTAVTAVLVSVHAIVQIPSGNRVSAPFEGEVGEPNTLGGYLVLMMSVLGAMALEAPRRRTRILLGCGVALMGVPLLYTLSRSSWLAAGAALVALLAVTRFRGRLLIAVALASALLVVLAPGQVVDRIDYTFTPHRDSVEVGALKLDASASARVRSWGDTLEDSMQHPILGHGVTGYHFIDAQYFRILAETGILGLAALGFLFWSLIRHSLRSSRHLGNPYLRGMCAGFIAAFFGLAVHAVGANTFIIVRIMEPFWLLAALVILAPRLDGSTEEGNLEPA